MSTHFSKFFILYLLFFIFLAKAVLAEGIVFPVAELGNCASKEACYAYCNTPANRPVCLAFAQSHNFMLTEARTVLGCTDLVSCKTFCSQVENHAKCEDLSKRFRKPKLPPVATPSASLTTALFNVAQKELGCNTEDTCKSFCSITTNYLRCREFLRRHMLGGEEKVATPSGILRPTIKTGTNIIYPPRPLNENN